MLKREKGKDASLGIDIKRKTRQAGIANLTYKEISLIFAYLDADTILMLHSAAKDVKSFRKNYGEPIGKSAIFHFDSKDLWINILFSSLREFPWNSIKVLAIIFANTSLQRSRLKLAIV